MRYTIYINIKVLLSEPHIFPNEGGGGKFPPPEPMGPCRGKLLFVIRRRWTPQLSPLANVRAKNLGLPDVAAGLPFHCLISLNLISGDTIILFPSAVLRILIVAICRVCASLREGDGRELWKRLDILQMPSVTKVLREISCFKDRQEPRKLLVKNLSFTRFQRFI